MISSRGQVLLLSLSFMCLFTAFKTTNMISKIVLEGAKADDATFTGNGYTSLGILYTVFALSSLISPSIVKNLGVKRSLVLGALFYVIYISGFLHPRNLTLYLTSGMIGFGAALLWTSQGTFMTLISDEESIYKNSSIFWAFNEGSLLIGSFFIFWRFHEKTINSDTRFSIATTLTLVGLLGIVGLCFLKAPKKLDLDDKDKSSGHLGGTKLFMNGTLALLLLPALFTGFHISFQTGVFASAVGFTRSFGPESVSLVGIIGILLGLGEVSGGILFGVKSVTFRKTRIIQMGTLILLTSYTLIYLNLPNSSTLGPTTELPLLGKPSRFICAISAYIMGFGDSCLQTQIMASISVLFENRPAPAFAIYKLMQSVGAAIAFYLSSSFGLYFQLMFLCIFLLLSLASLTFQKKFYQKIKYFLI